MSPLPVVLIHGLRLSASMWRWHRDALAAEREVLAVDLPGHGTRAGQPFAMTAATDAVAEAVDSLGGRALLAGISLGGYLAIATAAAHPQRVPGVVAMGCTAVPTRARTRGFRLLARLNGDRGQWLQRRLLRAALGRETAAMACEGGLHTGAVGEVLDSLCDFDVLAALSDYPGRTWLVNGTWDHFRADEDRFAAACRTGELSIVPRTGHLVSLTRRQHTAALISAAARRLEADRLAPEQN